MVMINCGAICNVVDLLSELSPQAYVYIVDSNRPVHLENVYPKKDRYADSLFCLQTFRAMLRNSPLCLSLRRLCGGVGSRSHRKSLDNSLPLFTACVKYVRDSCHFILLLSITEYFFCEIDADYCADRKCSVFRITSSLQISKASSPAYMYALWANLCPGKCSRGLRKEAKRFVGISVFTVLEETRISACVDVFMLCRCVRGSCARRNLSILEASPPSPNATYLQGGGVR